jgi:hypothetical protein
MALLVAFESVRLRATKPGCSASSRTGVAKVKRKMSLKLTTILW